MGHLRSGVEASEALVKVLEALQVGSLYSMLHHYFITINVISLFIVLEAVLEALQVGD